MPRSDETWIEDIASAIADIRADTRGMDFDAFSTNPAIVRSVLFSIPIIGEAAKNFSPAFKAAHPDIPWRAIAGTRRVWEVVTEDVDALEKGLAKPDNRRP